MGELYIPGPPPPMPTPPLHGMNTPPHLRPTSLPRPPPPRSPPPPPQLGAVVFGLFSDTYGRRPAFLCATLLVVVFGLLTVLAPGFWSLLLFRSMVGVGAGGMEVPFDLLSEIVPRREKSRCGVSGPAVVVPLWCRLSMVVPAARYTIYGGVGEIARNRWD